VNFTFFFVNSANMGSPSCIVSRSISPCLRSRQKRINVRQASGSGSSGASVHNRWRAADSGMRIVIGIDAEYWNLFTEKIQVSVFFFKDTSVCVIRAGCIQ
jgi:hypothetical protein